MRKSRQILAILLAGSILHSGPVAAYLCVEHDTVMVGCCPDQADMAMAHDHDHDRDTSAPAETSGSCDPVSVEALPSFSLDMPDPVGIGDSVLVAPAARAAPWVIIANVTPPFHGPPVYLSTLRIRL